MATSKTDRDMIIRDEIARKDSFMARMTEIFQEADTDCSGTVSWEELCEHLKTQEMQAYMSAMELDVAEAKGLFRLLDTQEAQEVSIDEFVVGCFRLKGQAKGLDLATLMYENKKMMETW